VADSLHRDIIRIVKRYWFTERIVWLAGGCDLDELLQRVRIKLWQVPDEALRDKGIGYRVQIVKNFLNDELRKIKARAWFAKKYSEAQANQSRGESGVYNETDRDPDGLTEYYRRDGEISSQKLAGLSYRRKHVRKPIHLEVMYDTRFPRKYHRCYVMRHWLILDVMKNQDGCVVRKLAPTDLQALKERLAKHRQEQQNGFLPLTLKGNKVDVTDYPVPRRLTDKDRRIRREDPIAKGQREHRKDFFEDFF
jgi:hypothetical protein